MHSCTITLWAWTAAAWKELVPFPVWQLQPKSLASKLNSIIQFWDFDQWTSSKYMKYSIRIQPCPHQLFHHPWTIPTWWPRLEGLKGPEEHATREKSTAKDLTSAKRATRGLRTGFTLTFGSRRVGGRMKALPIGLRCNPSNPNNRRSRQHDRNEPYGCTATRTSGGKRVSEGRTLLLG